MYNIGPKGKIHKICIKTDLPRLQELLFTLAVMYLINYRKYVARKKHAGNNLFAADAQVQNYKSTTLSVRLLARLIGISTQTVHRLKKSCAKLGFMEYKHHAFHLPWVQYQLEGDLVYQGYLYKSRFTNSL